MKRHVQCAASLMLLLMMTAVAGAADLEMVLASPRASVQGGGVVILDLYLHNNTNAAITRELPSTLPCRIETGRTTVTSMADLVDGEAKSRVKIPGRGIAKRQYAVMLPVYATGVVHVTLEEMDTNPLTIQVKKAPPKEWTGQQVPLDEGPVMLQSFLAAFSVYEPMYFLLGVDPGLEQSTFQFSFKYRLFNTNGYLAEKSPWLKGVHLAYTQRVLWDLKNESKPFEDTSYKPELFYLLPTIDLDVDRVTAFGIQGGIQHQSNGKGGDESRSTNYLYVKPVMGVRLAGPYHLKIAPKVFTYVGNDNETNGDLADYLGYFDLEVGVMDPEGVALNSHLWWAREGASVQLDLTYPMTRLLGKSLNFYLQAQYFSGYGETLLHYNERHDAFRLGFSIVR